MPTRPSGFDVRATTVPAVSSLRSAIEVIDRTPGRIALVVDGEGRLVGTLTDGDLRRAMLAGISLDGPVVDAMAESPIVARDGTSNSDVGELMRTHAVRQIPVVDTHGRVVDLLLAEAIEQAAGKALPVLIMAGGLGTRLGDLTRATPKPLVQIGDRPILEILVEEFARQGFRDLHLSVGHLAEAIERHFGDGRKFGVRISYVREPRPLGTAGAVGLIRASISGPFVVANADLITRVNFRALVDFHSRQRHEMTVAVTESTYELRYGVVETVGSRVTAIREKPAMRHFVNAGIYVLEPSIAGIVQQNERIEMNDLIATAVARKRVVGCFPIHEYWADVGVPGDLARATQDAARQRTAKL